MNRRKMEDKFYTNYNALLLQFNGLFFFFFFFFLFFFFFKKKKF